MRRHYLIALLPAIVTLAVFWTLPQADFISWDDDINVYQNPYLHPPTVDNVFQLWRQPYERFYVPLSYTVWAMLAHAALLPAPRLNTDASLIVFDPRVFHTANLALHVLNVLLVFGLLRFLLRQALRRDNPELAAADQDAVVSDRVAADWVAADWAAAAGAALFGVHPVQVEAVAWVSEMRGLLSGCLALLALWQYAIYATSDAIYDNRPRWRRGLGYGLATLCFGLALLAKPSAVAVPLIAWVLERWALHRPAQRSGGQAARRLLAWFALALVWTVVIKKAQPLDAGVMVAPLWERPLVAGDALAFYLSKLVLPLHLAPEYGRTPQTVLHWPGWGYLTWLAPAALAWGLWRMGRRAAWTLDSTLQWPWAAAGVFVAGLLPVLGLTPFIFQIFSTVADRYLYLAMLGPALGLAGALARWHSRAVQGAVVLVLFLLGCTAAFQTLHWFNSLTLFGHTLEVNPRSWVTHNNLGNTLRRRGDLEGAMNHYVQAFRIKPDYALAHYNLGVALAKQGQSKAAIAQYEATLAIDPTYFEAHNNLGVQLEDQGRRDEAITHYRQALQIKPDYARAHLNLAIALAPTGHLAPAGRLAEAEKHYRTALQLRPDWAEAHYYWGQSLRQAGHGDEAMAHYQAALELDQDYAPARTALEQVRQEKRLPEQRHPHPKTTPKTDHR